MIIAAAREEFGRRGFEGARVDRIARRAGVNKQLLFYYYHSKRGLFHAVLSRGARELEQALANVALPPGGERRPLERLRAALEAQFDFLVGTRTSSRCSRRPVAPTRVHSPPRSAASWSCLLRDKGWVRC